MTEATEFNEQGMQKLQQGEPEAAVKAFQQAVQLDPEFGQAWYGLGCAHGLLEEHEQAITAYERSAEYAGDKASLPLFNMGNSFQAIGKFSEAAQAFHSAVQADPQLADGWINLGRILDDAGNHEAAIECYDNALASQPDDVTAHSNRGNSLRSVERFQDALDSYNRALALDSSDFSALIGSGVCLVQCDRADEGLQKLQDTLEETQHPLAMFELGTALAYVAEHEAAVIMFDTLIENDFETPEIHNNRAECLAGLGRVDESLEGFDRAIELEDSFAPARFGKARVLVNAERLDEARPVAETYLAMISDEERQEPSVVALAAACGISET